MAGRRVSTSRRFFLNMIMILCILAVTEVSAAFKYLHEGMKAPNITGVDIVGTSEISTEKLNEGRVVLVVFWATWSERSLQQLQVLEQLATSYAGKPVQFVAVNVDAVEISADIQQQIRKIVADMKLTFPVVIDYGLKSFSDYGVIAVPSTAILDTTGVLRYGPAGYSLTTRDLIVDSIEALLGLRERSVITSIDRGYRPDKVAERYYYLAAGLVREGMYERALEHLDHSSKLDSLFPAPYCLRGEALLKLDSAQAAISAYRRAVTLDSMSIQARSGLGEALLKADQRDAALRVLLAAYTADSTFTPAVVQLSICLYKMDRLADADSLLEHARALNPREPVILYHLGLVKRKSGDSAKAIDSYREALLLLYPGP